MTETVVHPETGECYSNGNAEKALEAQRAQHARIMEVPYGFGGDFYKINQAIAATIFDLPPWIASQGEGQRGKYATLRQLMQIIQPLALRHGLHVTHGSKSIMRLDAGGGNKGWVMPVYTLLVHADSGSWKQTWQDIPLATFDAQAAGSAFTYGKRYTTLAAFGLATDDPKDDDDAESVQPRKLEDNELSDSAVDMIDGLEACETEKDYLTWRKRNVDAIKLLSKDDFTAVKSRAQKTAARVRRDEPDAPKTKRAPRAK